MEFLNEMLARNVRHIGDRIFIHSDDGDLTYAEFDRRASRLANVLVAHGAKQQEPVGLYLPSRLTMSLAYWACQKIGAIAVLMSSMYRETELRNALSKTEMALIVTDDETAPHIDRIRHDFPTLKHVLVDGAGTAERPALAELMAAASDRFENAPCKGTDIATMLFTSGTSGLPKAAMQPHFAQYSALRDMTVAHRTQFTAEVYYCTAPLFGNLGNLITNLCMFNGGSMVLHERWDTRRVLDSIKRYRVTNIVGTPTMYVYLMNEFDPARDDLTSLRICSQGGSPVSPVVVKKFEDMAGVPLLQAYGATETLSQNVIEPLVGVRKSGSAGTAIGSSRVEIVDDGGNPVPAGTIGEVILSGDCIGAGYWRDPEASAKTFTKRGWVSGDLGYLDSDGYLFIVDRKKDVIISGGNNIYPQEIENILYKHPAVAVCAALGVPDEAKSEIPAVVVTLRPGANAPAAELLAFVREGISAYKAPKFVYFIDEMPMGAGKIRKRELIGWIKDGTLKPA